MPSKCVAPPVPLYGTRILAGSWQCLQAMRHMAARFQLMFTVKGRAKRFALRADHEPGRFLTPQPQLMGSERFLSSPRSMCS